MSLHGDPPRLLVYGMQSSGASLFSLLIGQVENSVVVVDLWNPEVAPQLRGPGLVAIKATTGKVALDAHVESFRPTMKILFLRHPVEVATSLATKSYRDYGGSIGEKLTQIEEAFAGREQFDLTLRYEELATRRSRVLTVLRSHGVNLPRDAYRFRRTPANVVSFACSRSPWCRDGFRSKWGLGNAHVKSLPEVRLIRGARTAAAWEAARDHAPRLLRHYEALDGAEGWSSDEAARSQ